MIAAAVEQLTHLTAYPLNRSENVKLCYPELKELLCFLAALLAVNPRQPDVTMRRAYEPLTTLTSAHTAYAEFNSNVRYRS